jgi:hypothetical protein
MLYVPSWREYCRINEATILKAFSQAAGVGRASAGGSEEAHHRLGRWNDRWGRRWPCSVLRAQRLHRCSRGIAPRSVAVGTSVGPSSFNGGFVRWKGRFVRAEATLLGHRAIGIALGLDRPRLACCARVPV